MGYSARRGFSNGGMKVTGAQRQAEMQQKIVQMQEAKIGRASCRERVSSWV